MVIQKLVALLVATRLVQSHCIFCKFFAPTVEYFTHLSYFPPE